MDSGGAVHRGTQAGCSRAGSPASILWLLEDLRNLPRWGGDGVRHGAGRAAPQAGVEGPRPLLSPHSASFGLGSVP